VAAAAKLRNRGTEARFVLVGDTDPENPSAISVDTLKQWQSEGNIEWWGRREDMVNVYQQAQIIVLPSCREGLPKVLLEAAACGLPIVATDVPGCREIVINNENGMLVPARNVDMLAEAIAKLVNNPELRKQMGAKGRQLVEQEFSSEKVINETLRLYERLLNNKIASSLRSSQ
jgi:glycosyltransferase involved in cell wall biosynthesis